jgi:hypothetical protein
MAGEGHMRPDVLFRRSIRIFLFYLLCFDMGHSRSYLQEITVLQHAMYIVIFSLPISQSIMADSYLNKSGLTL